MKGLSLELTPEMYRLVLSKPRAREHEWRRIDIAKNGGMYQATMLGKKAAAHRNMDWPGLLEFVGENFGRVFLQLNAWDGDCMHETRATKKGRALSRRLPAERPPKAPEFFGASFDRQKNRAIAEGDNVPALVELGVFTQDFRVAAKKRDKFVQINHFLEIVGQELDGLTAGASVRLLDFGCGKSYLTFLLRHYLSETRGFDARLCGIDADEGALRKCRDIAARLGHGDISFVLADVGGLKEPPLAGFGEPGATSVAVCLHACNRAADHALANSAAWGADHVFVAPCCHHEFPDLFRPKNLKIFGEYGIIKERFCALATDLARAKLMEAAGYEVRLVDFVGFERTDKNLMLKARRTGRPPSGPPAELMELCDGFGFSDGLIFRLMARQ